MRKYVVDNIYDNGAYASVVMRSNSTFRKQLFTSDFVDGMKIGDKLLGLGNDDNLMPVAWVYRNRLHLVIEPISDYRIHNFVTEQFSLVDGMYFRYALMRTLSARGIAPTVSVTNNLRMFLNNKQNTRNGR